MDAAAGRQALSRNGEIAGKNEKGTDSSQKQDTGPMSEGLHQDRTQQGAGEGLHQDRAREAQQEEQLRQSGKRHQHDVPMLSIRQGEDLSTPMDVMIQDYERIILNPPALSLRKLQATNGPCSEWMRDRLIPLCSWRQLLIISDSTFNGVIPEHLPRERRAGSYDLPYGSVCICVEGGWRGSAKRAIEQLQEKAMQQLILENELVNISICQADSTLHEDYLAKGRAWLGAGACGKVQGSARVVTR